MNNRLISTMVALLAALVVPATASASPWVLEEDQLALTGRFDFQQANKEYFEAGSAVPYSLGGRYRAATFDLRARLGLVDQLELEVGIPLKLVSYRADPVILLPCEDPSLDCSQQNVISVSQTTSGIGDIRLATRYQFLEGSLAGAFEFQLKTPTGYQQPSGTFGDEPKSAADFKENVATYVNPDNVEDDVTLGDGQVDLGGLVLMGWALPTKTFVRLDAGYLLRLAGAGDQVLGHLQIGQALGKRVLVVAGSRLAYAVQDGEVIGVSVAAEDPTLPAEDYEGTKNLKLREVPLSHSALDVHGGVLIRFTRQFELKLSYSRRVWGRNTALTQTVSLGFGTQFSIAPETDE